MQQFMNNNRAAARMPSRHPYSGIVLAALLSGYGLAWVLALLWMLTERGSVLATLLGGSAALLLVADILIILCIDVRGLSTLDGLISWQRTAGQARFWLNVAFACCFVVMLGIYLVRAALYQQHPSRPLPQQAPVPQQNYNDEPVPTYWSLVQDQENEGR